MDLIFPQDVANLLRSLTATHYEIDGKQRLLQQFSTAGNSLTFVIESIVFWAISTAACATQAVLSTDSIGTVSVYGDDIIVPTKWAEGVLDWLTIFGFLPNESKSFISSSHLYRESCGVEYYKGKDVSSLYYPRFPIQGILNNHGCQLGKFFTHDDYLGGFQDSTSSLIDVQHKLYRVCMGAAQLVSELIKEAHPRMTSSCEGSLNGDIWDYDDITQVRYAPAASFQTVRGIPGDSPKGSVSYRHPYYDFWMTVIPTVLKIEGCTRDYKYRMRSKYDLQKAVSDFQQRLLDLYNYNQFLKYGPKKFSEGVIREYCVNTGEVIEHSVSDLTHAYDRTSVSRNEAYGQLTISWGFGEAVD